MKRLIQTALILCAAALAGGCSDSLSIQTRGYRQATEAPIQRVAVVDFAGEVGQGVADMLTMHLSREGFIVVERQYLSDLMRGGLEPIKADQTDATLAEKLSKVGKLLHADAIITGDLVRLQSVPFEREDKNRVKYEGAACELSARAFDVRTREVFWVTIVSVTASAKTGKQLRPLDHLNEACAELAESLATENYKFGSHVYSGPEIEEHRKARLAAGR